MKITRKQFLTMTGAAVLTAPRSPFAMGRDSGPVVSRIKYCTIGARDIEAVERQYTQWLGYSVVERSKVSTPMATAWGVPKTAGKPFVLMRPATGEDVLIRAVETMPVDGYRPMTTWGWNSFEIIVNDVDALHERLQASDFRHIGGPANLRGGTSSIRASQYIGAGEEVLYFNCETGDREKSPLPDPGEDVGRTNIVVHAGPNADESIAFYSKAFGLAEGVSRPTTTGVLARQQGLPEDTEYRTGFSWLREPGNAIQFDQYLEGSGPRPSVDGYLPPGNAIVSFNVDDLDKVKVDYITDPITEYFGNRSAVFVGPAGELVELIEQRR